MTSPLICWEEGALGRGDTRRSIVNWCQQGNLHQRKLGVVINLAVLVRAAQSLQWSMDHEPRTQEPPTSKFRRWHSALERFKDYQQADSKQAETDKCTVS